MLLARSRAHSRSLCDRVIALLSLCPAAVGVSRLLPGLRCAASSGGIVGVDPRRRGVVVRRSGAVLRRPGSLGRGLHAPATRPARPATTLRTHQRRSRARTGQAGTPATTSGVRLRPTHTHTHAHTQPRSCAEAWRVADSGLVAHSLRRVCFSSSDASSAASHARAALVSLQLHYPANSAELCELQAIVLAGQR